MNDDGDEPQGHGVAYPEHDSEWRQDRIEAKRALTDALAGYHPSIRVAVLSEILHMVVMDRAEDEYIRHYKHMNASEDDDPDP